MYVVIKYVLMCCFWSLVKSNTYSKNRNITKIAILIPTGVDGDLIKMDHYN